MGGRRAQYGTAPRFGILVSLVSTSHMRRAAIRRLCMSPARAFPLGGRCGVHADNALLRAPEEEGRSQWQGSLLLEHRSTPADHHVARLLLCFDTPASIDYKLSTQPDSGGRAHRPAM